MSAVAGGSSARGKVLGFAAGKTSLTGAKNEAKTLCSRLGTDPDFPGDLTGPASHCPAINASNTSGFELTSGVGTTSKCYERAAPAWGTATFVRTGNSPTPPIRDLEERSRPYGRNRRHLDGYWRSCRRRQGLGNRRHSGRLGCLRRPPGLGLDSIRASEVEGFSRARKRRAGSSSPRVVLIREIGRPLAFAQAGG